jgi:CoA-transferase family III
VADGVLGSTDASRAWATSGMMFLTGRGDGPALGGPAALVDRAHGLAADIARRSAALGRAVRVDPLAVMAERAGSAGHRRGGQVSCGGSSRLMRSADGWIAATMARGADWDLVPALLELPTPVPPGAWDALEAGVAGLRCRELAARAGLLGLPLSVLGERQSHPTAETSGHKLPGPGPSDVRLPGAVHGMRTTLVRSAPPASSMTGLVVADLSALWAGPLAGRLLAGAGARVVKVESASRPDGARLGDPRFYAAMNAGKESVAVDPDGAAGRELLARIVAAADVVITASRPRALEQLGLDPEDLVRHHRPRAWLMISGYGHGPGSSNRVAFGDDAAVAGGLVAWDGADPCFCGDAVADPLTGLAGAAAVLSALDSEAAWIIEASMADIAAGATGPALPVDGLCPSPPQPGPAPPGPVPDLGGDTARVVAQLGLG